MHDFSIIRVNVKLRIIRDWYSTKNHALSVHDSRESDQNFLYKNIDNFPLNVDNFLVFTISPL